PSCLRRCRRRQLLSSALQWLLIGCESTREQFPGSASPGVSRGNYRGKRYRDDRRKDSKITLSCGDEFDCARKSCASKFFSCGNRRNAAPWERPDDAGGTRWAAVGTARPDESAGILPSRWCTAQRIHCLQRG